MIKFVIGGARSGKTHFAINEAKKYPKKRIYMATGLPIDEEMREKIRIHREERGDDFETWEEPIHVPSLVKQLTSDVNVVVFDCLTTWVTNVLLKEKDPVDLIREFFRNIEKLPSEITFFIISNEVGMGIVPTYELSRKYRELLGRVNIFSAKMSDEVYFMVAGIPWKIK